MSLLKSSDMFKNIDEITLEKLVKNSRMEIIEQNRVILDVPIFSHLLGKYE